MWAGEQYRYSVAVVGSVHLCDHGLVAPEAAPWLRLYYAYCLYSAVAVVALWMTIPLSGAQRSAPGNSCLSGDPGNSCLSGATRGIPLYSRIRLYTAIHGYTAIQLLSWESSPEEWSELDLPHSRPRACARVTMRTRMMRARARVRAPARGDTP